MRLYNADPVWAPLNLPADDHLGCDHLLSHLLLDYFLPN